MAFSDTKTMFNGSKCSTGSSLLTNYLLNVGTRPECQSTNIRSLGNSPWINQSLNRVPSSTSTARFFTVLNQTLTCRKSLRMEKRIVHKSCIGSIFAPRNFGTDWILILAEHSLQSHVLMTTLRPASVSRMHTCGCDWMELLSIWTFTVHVAFLQKVPLWRKFVEEALLYKNYWQEWPNTPLSCFFLFYYGGCVASCVLTWL